MFKFIKKQNINKRGFSLVETLVALFVFSIAITATMAVMSQGITNINSAKKKVTASFLAQEGIEQVRNMRDTEVFYAQDKQTAWDNFFTKVSDCQDFCYLDDNSLYSGGDFSVVYCDGSDPDGNLCPQLKYDNTIGRYGYASGVNSGYVRTIHIESLSSYPPYEGQMLIRSTVYWKEGNFFNKNVKLETHLTNWAE